MGDEPRVPKIADLVQYVPPGRSRMFPVLAAIITYVGRRAPLGQEESEDSAVVSLAIFREAAVQFLDNVKYAESPTPGRWSWKGEVRRVALS